MASNNIDKSEYLEKAQYDKLQVQNLKANNINANNINANTITADTITANVINEKKTKKLGKSWLYSIQLTHCELIFNKNSGTLRFSQEDFKEVISFTDRPARYTNKIDNNYIKSYFLFKDKLFDDGNGNPNGTISYNNKMVASEFEIIIDKNQYIISLTPLKHEIFNVDNYKGPIQIFLDDSSNPYTQFWDGVFDDIINAIKTFVEDIVDEAIHIVEDVAIVLLDFFTGNFKNLAITLLKFTGSAIEIATTLIDPEFTFAIDALTDLKFNGKPVFPADLVYFLGAFKNLKDVTKFDSNVSRNDISNALAPHISSKFTDKFIANKMTYIQNIIIKLNKKRNEIKDTTKFLNLELITTIASTVYLAVDPTSDITDLTQPDV